MSYTVVVNNETSRNYISVALCSCWCAFSHGSVWCVPSIK